MRQIRVGTGVFGGLRIAGINHPVDQIRQGIFCFYIVLRGQDLLCIFRQNRCINQMIGKIAFYGSFRAGRICYPSSPGFRQFFRKGGKYGHNASVFLHRQPDRTSHNGLPIMHFLKNIDLVIIDAGLGQQLKIRIRSGAQRRQQPVHCADGFRGIPCLDRQVSFQIVNAIILLLCLCRRICHSDIFHGDRIRKAFNLVFLRQRRPFFPGHIPFLHERCAGADLK